MKGTQLNFFLLPQDLAALEEAWRRSVSFVAVNGFRDDGTLETAETLAVAQMGETPLRVYIVPSEYAERRAFFSLDVRGTRHIDITQIPAVELDRCYFDGRMLRRGRLYAATSGQVFPEHDDNAREQFRSWVRHLFSVARRHLIRQSDGTYLGSVAKKLLETRDIEIAAP